MNPPETNHGVRLDVTNKASTVLIGLTLRVTSAGRKVRIPTQSGHPFRFKPATCSETKVPGTIYLMISAVLSRSGFFPPIWNVTNAYRKYLRPLHLNPELDQEGASVGTGAAERIGKTLQRLHANRFHTHALAESDPIEVGTADVEEIV